MKNWILIHEECHTCGNGIEILTDAEQPKDPNSYSCYDSDEARCADKKCKERGQMHVDGEAMSAWYDPIEALGENDMG